MQEQVAQFMCSQSVAYDFCGESMTMPLKELLSGKFFYFVHSDHVAIIFMSNNEEGEEDIFIISYDNMVVVQVDEEINKSKSYLSIEKECLYCEKIDTPRIYLVQLEHILRGEFDLPYRGILITSHEDHTRIMIIDEACNYLSSVYYVEEPQREYEFI